MATSEQGALLGAIYDSDNGWCTATVHVKVLNICWMFRWTATDLREKNQNRKEQS